MRTGPAKLNRPPQSATRVQAVADRAATTCLLPEDY